MDLQSWILSVFGALGGTAGVAALANAVFGRKKTSAETTQIMTGSLVTVINELEEAAKRARDDSRASQLEVQNIRHEVSKLANDLHLLRTAIFAPDATIESLRALAISHPGTNGRSPA